MKKLFGILIAALFVSNAWAQEAGVRVAKLDFYKIQPLLIERVLSKAENAQLKDQYQAYKKDQKAKNEEMMKKVLSAQGSGGLMIPMEDVNRMEVMGGFELEQKVTDLARGEAMFLIEEVFGTEYQVVINDRSDDTIMYTAIAIPDITVNLQQYVLKQNIKEGKREADSPE